MAASCSVCFSFQADPGKHLSRDALEVDANSTPGAWTRRRDGRRIVCTGRTDAPTDVRGHERCETPRIRPRIACTRWFYTVCGEGSAWSRPRPWGDEGVSTLCPCTASQRRSPRLRTTACSPVEHAKCRAGRGGGISRKAHRPPQGSGPSCVDGESISRRARRRPRDSGLPRASGGARTTTRDAL